MMTQRITTLLVALALITLAATAQNAQKSTSNGKKSTIQLTQQYINFLKKKAQGKQQIAQKRSSDPATVTREQKVKEAESTQENDADESFDDFMGDLNANFDDFNQSMQQDFENFRNQINEAYANFLREAWKQFDADAPIPQPKEKDVPPVIKPQEDKSQPRPQEDRELPIKPVVVTIPKAEPQPEPIEPIEPIEEQPKGDAPQYVDFTVFGTQCRIRFGDEERFRLPAVNKDAIATCGSGSPRQPTTTRSTTVSSSVATISSATGHTSTCSTAPHRPVWARATKPPCSWRISTVRVATRCAWALPTTASSCSSAANTCSSTGPTIPSETATTIPTAATLRNSTSAKFPSNRSNPSPCSCPKNSASTTKPRRHEA